MTRIDPHTHSLRSDGTDTPEGLVRAAKAAQLDVVGLTDHDTFDGWAEAETEALKLGVGLLRGAEISTSLEGQSIHVLALLLDPQGSKLESRLKEVRVNRRSRLERIAQNVAVDYPLVSWDSIVETAGEAPLGRPHLADELVRRGYFRNRNETFEWVLSSEGPYYLPQLALDPIEGVRLIREAGGVPILAHPFSVTRGRTVPEELIEAMTAAGLFGIERDHRDHDAAARQRVDRVAAQNRLRISGGSDYHGSGKPNKLGENTLEPYILAEIEEQGKLEVIRA